MSCAKPYQNDLLLPGQQVVVIPLWSWHCERSDESLLFAEADMLACCSPLAPSFVRMSACSFLDIPQWAGIHCRTALLVAATCCRALVRFGSLWFWYACRMERAQRGIQPVCGHDLKLALWRQPLWGLLFQHGNWSGAFQRPCLRRLTVLLWRGPV